MATVSLIFCVSGYVSAGYVLLRALKEGNDGIGNCFLVGSGVISILTLFWALIFPQSLRLASFFILTIAIFSFLFYALHFGLWKLKLLGRFCIALMPVALLMLLAFPIIVLIPYLSAKKELNPVAVISISSIIETNVPKMPLNFLLPPAALPPAIIPSL